MTTFIAEFESPFVCFGDLYEIRSSYSMILPILWIAKESREDVY